MKKEIFLWVGIICFSCILFGCSSNDGRIVANDEKTIQNSISSMKEGALVNEDSAVESENRTENSNIVSAEESADAFGILISLPENTNWIADSEYCLVDEDNLKITYHDSIADADCTLLVSKNENLNLPENEYDEILDEFWEGKTIGGQNIVVKVQHGKKDGNVVLATWENSECRFAIMGEVKESPDSIPKVALCIISGLD